MGFSMRELIIDITYQCNSNCLYCQWSVSSSVGDRRLSIKQLLVPEKNLIELGISRIVITGGEPVLSENLNPIIEYYKNFNFPIRLISNGIELDSKRMSNLLDEGIREFIISIDSISYDIYSINRAISQLLFSKLIRNLENLSEYINNEDFFIGLNVVLTNSNCKWEIISDILKFAMERNINQVKFQPVFDDGYLSRRAPQLLLTNKNLSQLKIIRRKIEDLHLPSDFTNPIGFWSDLIKLFSGIKLNPLKCNVSENAVLLHKGVLKFCFWCQHINYGKLNSNLTKSKIQTIRRKFDEDLFKCEVLPQCFCLQPIDHEWNLRAHSIPFVMFVFNDNCYVIHTTDIFVEKIIQEIPVFLTNPNLQEANRKFIKAYTLRNEGNHKDCLAKVREGLEFARDYIFNRYGLSKSTSVHLDFEQLFNTHSAMVFDFTKIPEDDSTKLNKIADYLRDSVLLTVKLGNFGHHTLSRPHLLEDNTSIFILGLTASIIPYIIYLLR